MTDTTFDQRQSDGDERRSIGDWLAIGLTILLLAGFIAGKVQENDKHFGPDCTSGQSGEPGLTFVAQPATSDILPMCFPNPIIGEEFMVIPPR